MFKKRKVPGLDFTVKRGHEFEFDECVVPAFKSKSPWFTNQPSLDGTDDGNGRANFQSEKYKSLTSGRTVKACPSIRDIQEHGYVVKAWCDLLISFNGDEVKVQTPKPSTQMEFLSTTKLFPNGCPWMNPIVRMCSGMEIRSTPGVSLLQLSALEGFDEYLEVMEGICPTDIYPLEVKVMYGIKKKFDELYIPYGTPLMRLVPFRRETFNIASTVVDEMPITAPSKCPFFRMTDWVKHLGWPHSNQFFLKNQ